MKRSREVSIIVEALVVNSLLDGNRTDKARFVIKEAIKEIRRERYQKKKTDETGAGKGGEISWQQEALRALRSFISADGLRSETSTWTGLACP